ncbi:hypothetical protein CC80DRAFT_553477 [Byssothecium circinans]|uniref:Uncharacterized protein n=1 Tax=Byssothecium circinans TaxID=147558 RepID=A0A6A5TGQ6_9PLEO|nr:hypothetical protein CC80DRAFT_553477 [Byssothecium circinans]
MSGDANPPGMSTAGGSAAPNLQQFTARQNLDSQSASENASRKTDHSTVFLQGQLQAAPEQSNSQSTLRAASCASLKALPQEHREVKLAADKCWNVHPLTSSKKQSQDERFEIRNPSLPLMASKLEDPRELPMPINYSDTKSAFKDLTSRVRNPTLAQHNSVAFLQDNMTRDRNIIEMLGEELKQRSWAIDKQQDYIDMLEARDAHRDQVETELRLQLAQKQIKEDKHAAPYNEHRKIDERLATAVDLIQKRRFAAIKVKDAIDQIVELYGTERDRMALDPVITDDFGMAVRKAILDDCSGAFKAAGLICLAEQDVEAQEKALRALSDMRVYIQGQGKTASKTSSFQSVKDRLDLSAYTEGLIHGIAKRSNAKAEKLGKADWYRGWREAEDVWSEAYTELAIESEFNVALGFHKACNLYVRLAAQQHNVDSFGDVAATMAKIYGANVRHYVSPKEYFRLKSLAYVPLPVKPGPASELWAPYFKMAIGAYNEPDPTMSTFSISVPDLLPKAPADRAIVNSGRGGAYGLSRPSRQAVGRAAGSKDIQPQSQHQPTTTYPTQPPAQHPVHSVQLPAQQLNQPQPIQSTQPLATQLQPDHPTQLPAQQVNQLGPNWVMQSLGLQPQPTQSNVQFPQVIQPQPVEPAQAATPSTLDELLNSLTAPR